MTFTESDEIAWSNLIASQSLPLWTMKLMDCHQDQPNASFAIQAGRVGQEQSDIARSFQL